MRPYIRPLALCAGLVLSASGPTLAYDKAQPPPAKSPAAAATATATATAKAPADKLVDINVASRSELKSLPGIGDAEATMIIANRPYMTKTGLVEKKVLELEAYDALQKRIVVVHKSPPPKAKPSS
jgi:DNA uptake protein ComE-like DNA-binding protein